MECLKVKAAVKNFVELCIVQHGSLPLPDGYRSVGLAVIDATFSANSRYGAVRNIMHRIKPALERIKPSDEAFEWFDLDYLLKVHANFQGAFADMSFEDALADHLYFNRAVIGGRRKALVVELLAHQIQSAHTRLPIIQKRLNNFADFESLWSHPNHILIGEYLIADLQKVAGIGPATARYFLLLIGGPYVKPDVMTMRFVARTLERDVSPNETSHLLERAINELITEEDWLFTVAQVDHLIWQVESGRMRLD
jgi:hypothetical protein